MLVIAAKIFTVLADKNVNDEKILEACRKLTTKKSGLLIFLDDYHKHNSHQNALFDFLALLQITKEELACAKIPVGFIVAGIPQWVDEIKKRRVDDDACHAASPQTLEQASLVEGWEKGH